MATGLDAATQARATIWERIQSQIPPVEQDEVRRVIGEDIIDKNETLRQEVEALREILAEYQQQNEVFRDQLKKRPPLPEHPARVLLEQQIILLINSVKHSESKVVQSVLNPHSKEEQQLKDYVLKKHQQKTGIIYEDVGSRPGTSYGRVSGGCCSGRQTRPGTAGSSRSAMSIASAPADILEPLQGKLSVFRIEKLTKDLRLAFHEESAELLEDIEYLQSLLDMEHEEFMEEKTEALKPPPPIETLREYSAKLEKTWLMEDLHAVNEPSEFLVTERMKQTLMKQQQVPGLQLHAAFGDCPSPSASRAAQKLREKVHKARYSSIS